MLATFNQEEQQNKAQDPVLREAFCLLAKNFFAHNVNKNAAALAYYLLFALFPLLIFLCSLLGVLHLDIHAVTQTMQQFLPEEIVGLIGMYLDYVSGTSSLTLLWFALVFSIWFPMRAVKGLMDDVRRAYGLGRPRNLIIYTLRQLVYTVVFLIVIVLTLLLSTMGERVLSYILRQLPANALRVSDYLLGLWQYLRFLPVGLLMFTAIGTLYATSLEKRQPVSAILPGLGVALFSWLVVSIGFSFYVENFSSYTVVYGALGAVMVLMIWLYMTAIILILGAEFNAALQIVRAGRAAAHQKA